MTPGSGFKSLGWGKYDHRVNMYEVFKKALLLQNWRKSNCLVMMSMRPSIKIVKFITPRPGSGVRVQGWSLYAHISYIFKKYSVFSHIYLRKL